MLILAVYIVVGLFLFVCSQIATVLGDKFATKGFDLSDCLVQFVLFGMLWPIGAALLAYVLLKPTYRQD
jgi:cell shape-determining protein MreD